MNLCAPGGPVTPLLADLYSSGWGPFVDPRYLWGFLMYGYVFTVVIETPVLLLGLSPVHSIRRRLAAGVWLTACTYPIVVLVLPLVLKNPALYLAVAETFAPVAECALFSLAFHEAELTTRRERIRDWAAIVLANLASFLIGMWLTSHDWL